MNITLDFTTKGLVKQANTVKKHIYMDIRNK